MIQLTTMQTCNNLTQVQQELFDNLNNLIFANNAKPLDSFYIEISKGKVKHKASVLVGETHNVFLFEIENSENILKVTAPKS